MQMRPSFLLSSVCIFSKALVQFICLFLTIAGRSLMPLWNNVFRFFLPGVN